MDLVLFNECNIDLPAPFQRLLNRLETNEETSENDILFSAVVYNILECGFILQDEKFDDIDTADFNRNLLKIIDDVNLESVYVKHTDVFLHYEAKARIGTKGNPEATIIGIPSCNSSSKYMVINMLTNKPNNITTHCFKISDYIEKNSGHFKFKNRDIFSSEVKNHLAVPTKNTLLYYLNLNNAPVLGRMPQHVLDKISSNLNRTDKRQLKKAFD